MFLEPTRELRDGVPTGFYEGAVSLISCSRTEEGKQSDRMTGSQTKTLGDIPHSAAAFVVFSLRWTDLYLLLNTQS